MKCSGAATILMSNEGHLYACGENNENRLGLDATGLATWVTSSQVRFLIFCKVYVAFVAMLGYARLLATKLQSRLKPIT